TPPPDPSPLSLHDALPISPDGCRRSALTSVAVLERHRNPAVTRYGARLHETALRGIYTCPTTRTPVSRAWTKGGYASPGVETEGIPPDVGMSWFCPHRGRRFAVLPLWEETDFPRLRGAWRWVVRNRLVADTPTSRGRLRPRTRGHAAHLWTVTREGHVPSTSVELIGRTGHKPRSLKRYTCATRH